MFAQADGNPQSNQRLSAPFNVSAAVDTTTVTVRWSNPGDTSVNVERFAIMWQTNTNNGWGIASYGKSIAIPIEVIQSTAGYGTYMISVRADNDTLHIYSDWSNIVLVEISAPVILSEPSPTPSPVATPSDTATVLVEPTPTATPTVEPSPQPVPVPTPSPSPTSNPVLPEPSPAPIPVTEPVRADPVLVPPVQTPPPVPSPEPVPQPVPSPQPEPVLEPPALEPVPEPVPVVEEPPAPALEPVPAEEPPAPAPEIVEPPIAIPDPPPEVVPVPVIPEPAPELAPEPPIVVSEPIIPDKPEIVKSLPISQPNATAEERQIVAIAIIEAAQGEPVTAKAIQDAGITYEDLPPETPVEVRQDENGNEVVITAEVAAALVVLQNPSELINAIFTDPGQALLALVSIGADMSVEERKESEKIIIASVIAGQAAINAAGMAGVAAYRRKP